MKSVLDSIILFVQDVPLLTQFYIDNFDLELIEEIASEWVVLNAGKCNLALHKSGAPYETNTKIKVENNTKIVFEVESNLSQQREMLLKNKVIIGDIKTFDNYDYWVCNGEDPEGNIFQIKQRKFSR